MARRRGLGILLVIIIIGAIAGSAVGEVIGLLFGHFLPGSMVEKFFLEAFEYTFPPATLPLVICSITFGFTMKINIVSLLGIGIAVYYFRWY
jgi:ABC-type nitrate/sulfonate/bicarbonate transport system permease component